ncbi:MAG: hypothetical protein IPJ26_16365 [Bacteroidetes bacterium]|nr:hypothetical protein [Bacteroidota bacterium]
MKKKKIFKIAGVIILVGVIIGSGVAYYLFNMPHRDVQDSKTDFSLSASSIVNEYLQNADSANAKYLQEEGESKILAVKGKIFSISVDQKNQKVVLLKDVSEKAGVSCTFTQETNSHADNLKEGQTVTIKE